MVAWIKDNMDQRWACSLDASGIGAMTRYASAFKNALADKRIPLNLWHLDCDDSISIARH
jgi:hypothetical protein